MNPPSDNWPELLPRLRAVVGTLVGPEEVDDVTQEVCVRVLEKEHLWQRERGPFRAWITTLARNLVRNRRRDGHLRRHEALEVEPDGEAPPAIDHERVAWIFEQLGRLPERDRESLRLAYLEERSTAELARAWELSERGARKRVASAVDRLQQRARVQGWLSAFLPGSWAASGAALSKTKLALGGSSAAVAVACSASFFLPDPETSLIADTEALEHTRFAAGLDTPLRPEENLLWCGTTELAWGELTRLLAGPARLSRGGETADALARSRFRPSDLDPGSYTVGGGRLSPALVEDLQDDLRDTFGSGRDPVLDQLAEAAQANEATFFAYAFLAKSFRYPTVFEDLSAPLAFHTGEEEEAPPFEAQSFGISSFNPGLRHHERLESQVGIYDYRGPTSFAMRLHLAESTDRLLLGRVAPGETLFETWEHLRTRVAGSQAQPLEFSDRLVVPKLDFHLTHHFEELAGAPLENPGFEAWEVFDLRQDLALRLDERGVVLKSRSVLTIGSAAIPQPRRLVFDGPFLLAMIEEGAEIPYLVAWIANPELLIPSPAAESR